MQAYQTFLNVIRYRNSRYFTNLLTFRHKGQGAIAFSFSDQM